MDTGGPGLLPPPMGAPLMPGPYPPMPGPYGGPMDPNMAGGSPVVLASRLNEEVRLVPWGGRRGHAVG